MNATLVPPDPRPRRRLYLLVAAIGALVVGGIVLAYGTGRVDGPSPSQPPDVAREPDRPALVLDGAIREDDLAHDSRDDRYRVPFGAVPAGGEVTLRLRAAAGDLEEASVRVVDELGGHQAVIPMEVVATDGLGGVHGHDYWAATIRTSAQPTILHYRFVVRDGAVTRYIEDDPREDGGAVGEGNDGGPGRVYAQSPDSPWQITVNDPAFQTPAWARGAVVYQIFPDRFENGDPSNDPSPDATPGAPGTAAAYRFGDVYGNPILPKGWDERPEGHCRAYRGTTCAEGPLGRDFFGGDLAGITARLDDLADLGVTVLYLNPIFAAPSNHRYDTQDYGVIDPDLGTAEDFAALVEGARARGIRVVLDGVFNHVSSDSPWFDRARRHATSGACESAGSPFRAWFTFRAPGPNEPSPCAPSSVGGDDTYYVGWFGFDTIPELVELGETVEVFVGPDGVVGRWIEAGAAGWRLDVMENMSHGFVRRIREATKVADPDALVIGEQWLNSSEWLLGDQADTVMNYRFRRAAIGLVNGDTGDLDGAIPGLTAEAFRARMDKVREDYPAAAWDVLLNLVDSHDTTRILWTLTPGDDDPSVKESPDALRSGKEKLRLVAALQLTWPGMASIYYGSEAGLTGHDDPDDRRPYPWDRIDVELRDRYQLLARLRAEHPSIREGDIAWAEPSDPAVLAYVRRSADEAAVVVLNPTDQERTLRIGTTGRLPHGVELSEAIGDVAAVTSPDGFEVTLRPWAAQVWVTTPDADLAPPPPPGDVTATAVQGAVTVGWTPSPDAGVRYEVWRSLLAGGGFELAGHATGTTFTDVTVRNGTRYFYVVLAADEAGNVSDRSGEADALPSLVLADARLEGPAELSQPLSAVEPGVAIAARVRVDGVTGGGGPAVGLRVQLGLGAVRLVDPATDYAWSDMRFDAGVDGTDRYIGTVRPEELGTYNVALRVSTDGGRTWAYADRGGIVAAGDAPWGYRPDQAVSLGAVQGPDSVPPPVPVAPAVTVASGTSVTLAWDPVEAADLLRYEVYRGDSPEGTFDRVGSTVEPTFTDDTIREGGEYTYRVVAVDTGFNRSIASPPTTTAARSREVTVTFTVTVPPQTPAGDTIYIAGDFQGWDPGGTPMARVDARTWTIELPFAEREPPQYKYTRGTWEAVEKDDACGELPNRTFTVEFGVDGRQRIADEVARWRDVDQCG